MVERLNEPESRFHASLVTNICELVELLPRLNVNQDEELNRFAGEIRDRLCGFTARDLKKNEILRAATVNDAAEILTKMTAGFSSWVEYQLMSYFGVTITNIGVNEAFGSTVHDYSGTNWSTITAAPGYVETDGNFYDNICEIYPSGTPASLAPQSPLGTTAVQHAAQSIRVGSTTSGVGVQVLTNTHQVFQDHGRYLSVMSPP